ncbi:MAG: hypothetical protein JWM80_1991 [Cyanobacteria bacterium RYN_339]|nr:hypothetical protein [Cyanobacteria bacterium RYN_339]
MPIPPFEETNGYLPPAAALYVASEAEIEVAFGSASEARRRLFGHLQRLTAAARRVEAVKLLVDGSFVTDKERTQGNPPNDIDCAIWLGPGFGALVREANMDAMFIVGLNATNKLGPLDLHFAFAQDEWERWSAFFSTDRQKDPKGCVEVIL